jgi:hypothetical protein
MELIGGSETSANHNRTPGKYSKEYLQEYITFLLQTQFFNLILPPLTLVGDGVICLSYSDSAVSEL